MIEVTIKRQYESDTQTIGVLMVYSEALFVARTFELPWRNNKRYVSCIPTGRYDCIWSHSPILSMEAKEPISTYEVIVENRNGIRITDNRYHDAIKRCIVLGDIAVIANNDNDISKVNSIETLKKFNAIMNQKPFSLMIT